MDALRELGQEVWFTLGDRDLATHLLRTGLLRSGVGLTEVTARLAAVMDVAVQVLPATEDEVRTRIEITGVGCCTTKEFLVRHGALPTVRRVVCDGARRAAPAPGVPDALVAADLVVLAPSNPMASIAPILAVPDVQAVLRATRAEIVAVTPIVSRVPLADPGEERRAASRAKLLGSIGVVATAAGVAGLYRDLAHRFVLDAADADQVDAVAGLGLEPVVARTLLHRGAPAADLVAAVLGARP
jgi:LPPG:FO 2-phospho-L-lactate transferase